MKVEHILNSSSTNALKKKKEYKTGENPFSLLKSVLFVARVGLKEGKLSHKFCCTIYIYIKYTATKLCSFPTHEFFYFSSKKAPLSIVVNKML